MDIATLNSTLLVYILCGVMLIFVVIMVYTGKIEDDLDRKHRNKD